MKNDSILSYKQVLKNDMKKIRIVVIITVLLVIVALGIFLIISSLNYQLKHTMCYQPEPQEEIDIAKDMGITLSDDLHIESVLLNKNKGTWAIRFTGVKSVESFLSHITKIRSDYRMEDEQLVIDDKICEFRESISNYDETNYYKGYVAEIKISAGAYEENDKQKAYDMDVVVLFMFDDNGLASVEYRVPEIPYYKGQGSGFCNKLYSDYYWKDYILYPVIPHR